MKKYVFIITDRNRGTLHVGMSTNLIETMNFYRQIPDLSFNASQKLTRLVYFEELNSESDVEQRFQLINKFTRMQKERLIRKVNTNWIDLTSGLDYEVINHSYKPAA